MGFGNVDLENGSEFDPSQEIPMMNR